MINDLKSQEPILKNIQNDIRLRLRKLQETLNLTQEEMAKLGSRKRITYAE
jgi:DNA-binding XRE family transcriptional regulator